MRSGMRRFSDLRYSPEQKASHGKFTPASWSGSGPGDIVRNLLLFNCSTDSVLNAAAGLAVPFVARAVYSRTLYTFVPSKEKYSTALARNFDRIVHLREPTVHWKPY